MLVFQYGGYDHLWSIHPQYNILMLMDSGPFKDLVWSKTIGIISMSLMLPHVSWAFLTS